MSRNKVLVIFTTATVKVGTVNNLSFSNKIEKIALYWEFMLYGAEVWGIRTGKRKKVNILEIKHLRSLMGVSQMDRV